ncbi:MAG: hypothetical protein U0996_21520 [Planctomycetaceae bacterium]
MKHIATFLILLNFAATACVAQQLDSVPNDQPVQASEVSRRKTAVTLNYCRAALHRIRRAPSKQVLLEEQQRILNNLDLNQIDDPEVISLYRSILDEIGQVEIGERERVVIDEQFRRGIQRKLGTDFFVIGAQAATGQVGSVIQSGANSWWDYRSTQIKRDSDMWQVEKSQFTSLMTRSSTFLDSFWKLSRKNDIPDRWLLRDQDLDLLGETLAERDPERRLRMLARNERFMECYPPYWYYVARTQQQLGRTQEAAETFRKLAEIGQGHFRQDDMLASSMANLSLIQESEKDPDAPNTAMRAFEFSTRNWEANLVCAWVLGRHERYRDAEDLILCNVDEDLETEQSSVALVSLYFHSADRPKLKRLLNDETIVRRIPVPGLLLCAKLLGPDDLPRGAATYLASTLTAIPRTSGRTSAISVAAARGWKLNDADVTITDGSRTFEYAGHRQLDDATEVSFAPSLDSRTDGEPGKELKMTVRYPGTPPIQVVLLESDPNVDATASESRNNRRPLLGNAFGTSRPRESNRIFRIQEIEVDGVRLSLQTSPSDGGEIRVLKPEFSDSDNSTRS